MRFLFLNQYHAPDIAATAQLLADIAEHLASEGHEVHVISGTAPYDGPCLGLAREEVLGGVHVHRVAVPAGRQGGLGSRAWSQALFLAKALWKACRVPRPDVVVTLTTPPLLSVVGALVKTARGCRFVHWALDIYPDIAVRAGVVGEGRLVHRAWSWLEAWSRGAADGIITLGEDMRGVLVARGVEASRVHVQPCWASAGETVPPCPGRARAFREAHARPGACLVMYSGNMGVCHTFGEVTEGIKLLRGEGCAVDFLFVGGGKRVGEIRSALEGVEGVGFLPYQPREDLADTLAAPDAHLVTLDPAFDGLVLPSKLLGAMAAGKPVLLVGSETTEAARLVHEAGCGLVTCPGDAEAFAGAARWLAGHPAEREELGRRGREHFAARLGRSQALARMARLLEEAASS